MSEISRKVIPYEYNYLCDSCERGMMKPTGRINDGMIEHQCMICSHQQDMSKTYPHIEYFGEGEEPDA